MEGKCQELQAVKGSAVSTLCDALPLLCALQAEVPVSGKKRIKLAAEPMYRLSSLMKASAV